MQHRCNSSQDGLEKCLQRLIHHFFALFIVKLVVSPWNFRCIACKKVETTLVCILQIEDQASASDEHVRQTAYMDHFCAFEQRASAACNGAELVSRESRHKGMMSS